MIPRTYPSRVNSTTGRVEALVSFISSTTGLQRWVDYTPVAFVTDATPVEGSYNNNGYIAVADVGSTAGLQSGKDYIRVYLDPNATDAWRVNSVGFIPVGYSGIGGIPYALFANNEQGVWYDPSDINLTWRRNLLTYTEQFDNAIFWAKLNATITADAVSAPDGLLTADKLVETASAATTHSAGQVYGATSGSIVTFSVYCKAAERSWVRLTANTASGANASAYFNLASGSLGSVGGGSATMTSVGNGWYRCTVIGTLSTTNPSCAVLLATADGGQTYAGDGTSGIYIWGAQLEVGSTASTYQRITDGVQDYYAYQAQPVLFQDSAGTTPVTAVEQPVGLMLDKSKGLVLGPELVTNGTFDTDTAWTKETGWSISGGAAVASGVNSFAAIYQSASVVVGRAYLVTFTVSNYSAGQVYAYAGAAGFGIARSANGTYTQYIFASGTSQIALRGTNGFTGSVDNISVRELPGNHAFQATSTSRPVLSARYNLLTKTEQFDDAAWTKGAASVSPNVIASPVGTTTADKLVENTSGGTSHNFTGPIAQTSGVSYTASIYVKAGERTRCLFGCFAGTSAFPYAVYDLSTGTVVQRFGGSVGTITAVGDGWYLISERYTAETTGTNSIGFQFQLVNTGTNTVYTGDGTSGLYMWGADVRVTNDAAGQPAYQRVNTATDYDTAGFKPYLRFDGTDDWLQTNSVNFSSTDKMTVFAGVRKLSDAAGAALVELSLDAGSSSYQGSFAVSAPASTAANYRFGSKGSAVALASALSASSYAAPITNVVTGIGDISGDSTILRVNGTQAASSATDQGTGNYGNYPLYIGRRGGTTLPFNGRLYGLIVRGAATTTATIQATETYMNGKTGAY